MFRVARYFSITSLLGIVVTLVVLSTFYTYLASHILVDHETRANQTLAKVFSRIVMPEYLPLRDELGVLNGDGLRNHQFVKKVDQLMRGYISRTNVIKVKIYSLSGLTVYSSDPAQIGEDKSDNKGFLTALRGDVTSGIVYRNRFDTFEGTLTDRNVLFSYLPIRDDNGSITAVFELYSDVTDLLKRIERTEREITIGILVCLTFLYLFLYLFVRRADTILQKYDRERQANENRIRNIAYHDILTGLPNRVSFQEHITEKAAKAEREQSTFGLLFLDLDKFKNINDTYGHEGGDVVLKTISFRLKNALRGSDTIYRISGDEFVVLLDRCCDNGGGRVVAEKMLQIFEEPINISGNWVRVTGSIGITQFPHDGKSADELLRNADSAMYSAKEQGRNCYAAYDGTAGACLLDDADEEPPQN